MNAHDRLRRELRDALPADDDFPSPRLRERVVEDLSRPPRRPPARYGRRWSWLPSAAVLVAVVALVEPVLSEQVPGAGRVEFLSTHSFGQVEFLSSTAQPASEYRAMYEQVLKGFDGTPDFNSQPTGAEDVERIVNEEESLGRSTVDLVALTHGDLLALQSHDALEDLTPLLRRLQNDRRFAPASLDYGRLDTDKQYYIPWLQATYLMVVNKKALAYKPDGADVNHLTYDQLIEWGRNMQAGEGRNLVGLPADLSKQGGLIHRFLQGYTYPSYTGTTLTGFESPDAVTMWEMLRRLWAVSNADVSSQSATMGDALVKGQVWVAWDHQARLAAPLANSHDFMAIPAPSGPHGLGYMTALVGLAIPKGAPNREGAEALIDWLTRPRLQAAAAASLSFFPVVQGVNLTGAQALEQRAAYRYHTYGTVETLLPVGLGIDSESLTSIYKETFKRIVVNNEDIVTVLNDEAEKKLQPLLKDVRCWPPDPPSRPCPIT